MERKYLKLGGGARSDLWLGSKQEVLFAAEQTISDFDHLELSYLAIRSRFIKS
jgi:hypothetical protein